MTAPLDNLRHGAQLPVANPVPAVVRASDLLVPVRGMCVGHCCARCTDLPRTNAFARPSRTVFKVEHWNSGNPALVWRLNDTLLHDFIENKPTATVSLWGNGTVTHPFTANNHHWKVDGTPTISALVCMARPGQPIVLDHIIN